MIKLLVVLVLLAAGSVHAADQTVLGKSVSVANPRPTDPTRRALVASGRERQSPNTVVGNPSIAGATVTFFVDGASSANQAFVLPAAGWKAKKSGYQYRHAVGSGAVSSASLTRGTNGAFTLRVRAKGRFGPINIVPPNPGTNACVRLDVAGGDSYHVLFQPGTVRPNNAKRFGIRKPPAEGLCPGTPPVTTTTTSPPTTTLPTTSTTSSTSTTATTSSTIVSSTTTTTTTTTNAIQCCKPVSASAVGCFVESEVACAGEGGINHGAGSCVPDPCGDPTTTTTTLSGGTTTTTVPALGARTFTIANGAEPNGSHFTIAPGNNNSLDAENANTFVGSLAIVGGSPDANGVAALALSTDALIGFKAADGSTVCLRLRAAGSGGKVDCDGGTPVGVSSSQDSNGTGADAAPVLTLEQGAAGGAGDAYVSFTADFVQCTAATCPTVLTPSDCLDASKPNYAAGRSGMSAATSGTATATITNARQGGTATLSKTGQPLSCSTWSTDGPGVLEIPATVTDAPVLNQDLAVAIQLDD